MVFGDNFLMYKNMTFPTQIYKAYDIRGIYPDELNEDIAYRTGRAFAEFIKKDQNKTNPTVVVGYDMRSSSVGLTKEIIKGISGQGVNIVNIGLASTPTFYYAIAKFGYDGGLEVSASHNPAKYNGFKMTRDRAKAISGDSGIKEIRDMAEKNEFNTAKDKGEISERNDIVILQTQEVISKFEVNKIKPFKIAIDTANGMGSLLMEELFKNIPCQLIKINWELDGNFPNHEADPLKDENNKQLQDKVLEIGADLGIALDGDGDRIFFIDNTGKTIEPAIIRGILSKIYLKENPGATICYDIRPGRITEDMILQYGGKPVITKVGHSLIKEKAIEVGAVFAGESSGHFFIKNDYGIFEEPIELTLRLLLEWSKNDQTIAEQIKPLQRYYHSGEINFAVEDKQKVFNNLRDKYGDNLKHDFDGVSFEFDNYWFNIRASNTEDKVRLNLEAINREVMIEKTKEVSEFIKS